MMNNNYKMNYSALGKFQFKTAVLFSVMFLITVFSANAQLTNVPVTGYNNDIIANGVGATNTATTGTLPGVSQPGIGVDGNGPPAYSFVDNTYKWYSGSAAFPTCGIPATIASALTPGLTYSTQSASANNSMTIASNTYSGSVYPTTGAVTLVTPSSYGKLYILYESVLNTAGPTMTDTVTFTDATFQVFSGNALVNWFTNSGSAYTNNQRAQNAAPGTPSGCGGGPYLFEMQLQLSAANFTKTVQKISFNWSTPTGGAVNTVDYFHVMAIGGLPTCATPSAQATSPSLTPVSTSQINGSFTAAAGSPTGYLVVRYAAGSTPTNPATGTLYSAFQTLGSGPNTGTVIQSSAATSFSSTGLTGGTSYDYYVYSYNNAVTCGGPIYLNSGAFFGNQSTLACASAMSGTVPIGPGLPNTPGGGYTNISGALTYINANGLAGATILELQTGYTTAYAAANEVYPLTFNTNPCINAINNLTIRPAGGVGATIALTSAAATASIIFNGANYVTIDGRPGGAGTTSFLSIANTNVASASIQFTADASNNVVKYCTVTSVENTATNGTIAFTATATSTGNDNNTIDNCSILAGGTNPVNGIYSAGASAIIDNSNNTISNCNIADYFSATLATNGILLTGTGNSTWTIINNRLYQTATRTYTTGNAHFGINIGTGSGYIIAGNTIGFANSIGTGTTNMVGATIAIAGFPSNYAAGTGTSMTYTAINVALTAGGTNTLIQSNIIAGFAVFSSTTLGIITGINVTGGNVTVGGATAILGNTIGATTGQGSLYAITTTTGGAIFGIRTSPATGNTSTVQNNTMGAIDAMGTTATIGAGFVGIDGSGAGNIVQSNNTIGNATADNIRTGYTTLSGVTATNLSNVGIFVATGTTGVSTLSGIRSTNTGNTYDASNNTIRGWATNHTTTYTVIGLTAAGVMTGANPSVTLNSNVLGTATLGWIRYVATNTGVLTGISTTNTIATVSSIQNNDIRGIVYSGAAGTGAHNYLTATGGTATGNVTTIAGNTFTNLNVNTTGSVTFIAHSYTVGANGSQIINNNSIVTAFNKGGAGGTVTCMTSGSSTILATAIVQHTNNNFSNITVTGATTLNGITNTDGLTTTAINRTITGNIFNNWIGGTSAITVMNYAYWGGTTSTLSSNTITNITGQSTIVGIQITASGNAANPLTISNNTVTGLSSTGTGGAVSAITCNNTSPAVNIFSNTINTVSSTGASNIIAGIAINGAANTSVYLNTINGMTGSGATSPTVNGISVSAGTLVNVYRNKIYDLSQSAAIATTAGAVNGIALTGGTTVNAYNNLIGDLRAPLASLDGAIRGISVTSATANTSYNVYFNTIYLNATSSGAIFSTTGVFHAANATATTAKLDLRNNIVINLSTPNGAGIVSAYRRSVAATFGNYATTSNNNYLYAGTPSANQVILNDNGTVYSTFGPAATVGTFQNIVAPREGSSRTGEGAFTYSIPGSFFQSLTGSSLGFLHIVNAITTLAESGGQTITTPAITDDYDAQVRNVTTPDIGADEFNGTSPAPTITSITLTPGGNQCTASNHVVSATFSTPSGTITGGVINYSYNGIGQAPITMTNSSGSTWTGTIPAAISPTNATVAWSITASNDVPLSTTVNGTSYNDEPLFGITSSATASVSPICAGTSTSLSALFSNPGAAAPTYIAPPAVSNPTTDEDFGNITITQGATTILNNTTTGGSLTGTIGVATGIGGSYSNFTSFGPYNLIAGSTYNCSLTSITQGGSFGNAMAIYIDYNRNGVFTDAGEAVYNQGATITGPHTSTGSFTVPSAATTGLCRMRVMVNEGTVTSPTQTLTWGEYEEYSINLLGTSLGAGTTTFAWSDGTTNSIGTTNPVTVSPTTTTVYTVTATQASSGCSVTATTSVTVNPLPTAPTATNSSQCGVGIPTASVTSTSGAGAPQFYWYSAPSGGTVLQTPPSTPLSTYYSNDFSSAVLTNSSLAGAAAITGGVLALQPQPTSSSTGGSITVNASGVNSNLFQTDFDIALTSPGATMADGFSYCFGDDAIPLSNGSTPTAEHGSGSKLRLGFLTFNGINVADGRGIYLMYGVSATTGYTSSTPGVLGYSTNVAWLPTSATTINSHITATINAAGQITIVVGGITVFNNVQLPAGFLSSNKSTWKHIISSRSGGTAGGYAVDNLVIQANAGYGSGSTTYLSSIATSQTFYVTEKDPVTGCESSPRTPVTATVTFGDNVAPVAQISGSNITQLCIGNTFQLSTNQTGANSNAYSYTWTASSTNSGITGSVSGGTFASPTTLNVTPLAAGTYIYTVTYTDGVCNGVNTISITVNPLPVITSAVANPNPICAGSSATLTALTGTPAGNAYQEPFETFPASFTTTGTGVTWAGSTTYFIQGAASAKCTYAVSCDGSLAMNSSVSLVGLNTPQLKFWHICATENSFDYGRIEYSTDGGTVWTGFPVAAYQGAGTLAPNMVSAGVIGFQANSYTAWSSQFSSSASVYPAGPATALWKEETINLGAYAASANFRVRFRLTSDPSVLYAGWSVDDVRITYASSSGAGTLNWQWNPGALSGNIVTVSPSSNTTFTVTGTNPATGCSSTSTVSVTVNPLPSQPTTSNSPSTQCGYAMPAVAVADPNGFTSPTFKWYSAPTGGTLLQSSTSTTYTTVISSSTTFYVSVINPTTGCESARTQIQANVTPFDPISITANSLTCEASPNAFSVVQSGSTNVYQYSWSASPVSGSGVVGTPTGSNPTFTATLAGTYIYTVTGTESGSGCVATASKSVTVYQGLSGTVSATQITSCTNPTGLITANVSGAGTVVNNDFSNPVLPANMTSAGTGFAITGGQMQLTPAVNGQSGGVLISNPTGLANNDFQIDFDMITTTSAVSNTPADGFSYSYGDDVVALPTGTAATGTTGITTLAPENGSGTKLKLSFDAINNTGGCTAGTPGTPASLTSGNVTGVYLMYNSTTSQQGATCPGVIYFDGGPTIPTYTNYVAGPNGTAAGTGWRATTAPGSTTHVTIKINALGQVSLFLNNIQVVFNQQLPASYLSANKASWKHAFCARTGGLNEGHYIDNLLIQYNNFYEYSINGGGSWSTTNPIIPPGPGTYSVDARYVSVPGCTANLGSVTINQPAFTTASSANNSCAFSSAQPTLSFLPSFPGATYQWDSAATGSNNWAAIAGATNATYTLPQGVYFNNTDFRCHIYCSGNETAGSPSSTKTILVYSPTVATTTPGTRCGIGSVNLAATTTTAGATLRWYAASTGGTALGTGSPFATPIISTNTTYYVSSEIGSGGSGTAQFGTGTATNTNTGYPAPLGTYYGGARHQMLILASELSAQGLSAGSLITGLTLDVSATNSANPMQLYTVNMKGTSASALTSTFETGLTEVISANTYSAAAGINTLAFNSSNFVWNGTDNIIVETIYNNNVVGTSTNGNCSVKYTTTGFTSVNYSRVDNGGAGLAPIYALASSGTSVNRPNMQLVFSGGCPSPRTAVLATVTPAPAVTVSAGTTICQADSTTLTASSTNDPNYNYTWNPGGFSGANYKVAPAVTTTYTVTAIDNSGGANNNCQDIKTITITVTQRPTISSLTSSPAVLCQGDSAQISLSATPFIAPSGNYTVASTTYATQTCPSTAGPTGDDVVSGALPIGFNFNYYGTTYSQFAISTNGNIQLGNGSGTTGNPAYSSTFTATALPTAGVPNNTIALCWADLISSAGNITYGTTGVSPNQKLIVCYNNIPWLNATGNLTGQIIISEGSANVKLMLTSVTATTGNRVCGVENATGTLGTMAPGRTVGTWTTSNEGWIFSPPVSSSLTYAWSPSTGLSSSTVQNPKASPNSNTTYTVTVSETGTGCSRNATIALNVTPKPKSYIQEGDSILCSNDPGFYIHVKDSGAYSGGYPAGTTFEFVGLTPSSNTDDSTFISSSTTTQVIVTLPGYLGSCTTTTGLRTFDFGATQAPQILLTSDSVLCFGESTGNAYVSIVFGDSFPAFRYQWYNSANVLVRDTISSDTTDVLSGMPTGMYTLILNDHQGTTQGPFCSVTDSVYVGQPLAPLAVIENTVNHINVLCNGALTGAIDITVSGGTPNATTNLYSYNWSNGATTQDLTGIGAGTYTCTITDSRGCTFVISSVITQPTAIVLGATVNQILCNGGTGSVSLNVTGGVSPYVYAWSNSATTSSISGLLAGTYTVTVTDFNNCTKSGTYVINSQPTAVTANCSATPVSCFGGSNGTASVTAGGGTPGYTYLWNTSSVTSSISGLTAGTYTVTITDANGCSTTCTSVVTQPTAVTANCSATPVSCFGGSNGTTSATAGGGTPGYTYLWNTSAGTSSISGLTAGTYTVTVTDANGCSTSCTSVVTQPTAASANCSATPISCFGGSNGTASVTAGGGTPGYAYLWNTSAVTSSISGLIAGTYIVTVTDANGCSISCSSVVTQPTAVTANCSATSVSCFGGSNGTASVIGGGGAPGYTYLWSTTAVTSSISSLTAGTYTVTVTDGNGCSTTCTSVVTEPTALTLNCSATANTCFESKDGTVSVIATGGTGPYSYDWSNGSGSDTQTSLSIGVYTVTVTDANGCSASCSTEITEPAPIVITIIKVDPTSSLPSSGSINTSVAGGTAPYSYAWSNGPTTPNLSSLGAGVFTLVVTDAHGCSVTVAVTLTYECQLSYTNTVVAQPSCGKNNGVATVTGTGGTGYTYSWQTSPVQTTATATGLSYYYNSYVVITDVATGCTLLDIVTLPTSTGLTLTLTSPTYAGGKNIRCNGGSDGNISLTVSGSTGPYTYLWSNGATTSNISGLTAGTYIVTVSNGGCTNTNLITLLQPTPLTAVTTSTNGSCGGPGTASVAASGGVLPYSYSWNTVPVMITASVTGLTPGSYTVTVSDANGCTKTSNVIITTSAGLNVTGVITNVSCNGGTNGKITPTASGGSGPYTYLWNNGSTVKNQTLLIAGNYTLTVTDSKGCTGTYSGTITQPSALTAIASTTPVSCYGGSNGTASALAGGGTAPYTYSWNTVPAKTGASVTGLKSGTYTVIVTDSKGCLKGVTVTITQPSAIVISISKTNVTTFGGSNGTATANVSGGLSPYSYSWNTVPVKTTQTATGLIAGTYIVTVTDVNGCTKTASVTITQPVARLAGNGNAAINSIVYPNPTTGKFTVSFDETIRTNVNLQVFSITGERVFMKDITVEDNASSFDMDLSVLTKGIYFIRYRTNDKDWMEKLVIQ